MSESHSRPKPSPEVVRMRREASDRAMRSTVALYMDAKRGPVVQGSGVLFRVADVHFVLTALHVAREFARTRSVVRLATHGPYGTLVAADRVDFIHSSKETGENGEEWPVDVAVMILPPAVVSQVSAEASFVTMAEIDVAAEAARDKILFVHGHPCDPRWAKRDREAKLVTPNPLSIPGPICDAREGKFRFPVLPCHIAAKYDPAEGRKWVGPGEPLPTDLRGMSGCGMWTLGPRWLTPENWLPEQMRLAGILHTYNNKVMLGTRIQQALFLAYCARSELRRPMDLTTQIFAIKRRTMQGERARRS